MVGIGVSSGFLGILRGRRRLGACARARMGAWASARARVWARSRVCASHAFLSILSKEKKNNALAVAAMATLARVNLINGGGDGIVG